MITKGEKLQNKQDRLKEIISKKLTKKEKKYLSDIINIEYKLTMEAEGHDINIL